MRLFIFSIIYLFSLNAAFALPKITNQTRLKDIPININIDSLENVAINNKNNPELYLYSLIVLERSREQVASYKYSSYANTIDSLGQKYNIPFAIGYANYSRFKFLTRKVGNLHMASIYGDKALAYFESIHDTSALMNLTCLKAVNIQRMYSLIVKSSYLREMDSTSVRSINSNFTDPVNAKIIFNSINRFSSSSYSIIDKIDLQKYSLLFFSSLNNTNYDSMIVVGKRLVEFVKQYPEYDYTLGEIYNVIGATYNYKEIRDTTLYYFRLANASVKSPESFMKIVTLLNMGLIHASMDKTDSALYYLKATIDLNKKYNWSKAMEARAYMIMSDVKAFTKDYKSAYEFRVASMAMSQDANSESKATDYFSFLSQQEIDKKENERKIFATKEYYAKLALYGSLFILALIGFFSFYLYRSRKKLSVAYAEIKDLQTAREKFFSIIAHDLRSPLSTFIGLGDSLNYLIKKERYKDISAVSKSIDETGVHLNHLMSNLLSWGKIQHNIVDTAKEDIYIQSFFDEIMPIYYDIANYNDIHLILVPFEDCKIHNNKNILSTIVRNMLDNALKNSTSHSKISVSVKKEANHIILNVSNPYQHASKNKIDSVAQYFNSNAVIQPGQNGFGLGMYIIKTFLPFVNGTARVITNDDMVQFEVVIATNN